MAQGQSRGRTYILLTAWESLEVSWILVVPSHVSLLILQVENWSQHGRWGAVEAPTLSCLLLSQN